MDFLEIQRIVSESLPNRLKIQYPDWPEYAKFIYLKSVSLDLETEFISPPPRVASLWRQHVLCNIAYKTMCQNLLGSLIGHDPDEVLSFSKRAHRYLRCRSLYTAVFRQEPPRETWPLEWTDDELVELTRVRDDKSIIPAPRTTMMSPAKVKRLTDDQIKPRPSPKKPKVIVISDDDDDMELSPSPTHYQIIGPLFSPDADTSPSLPPRAPEAPISEVSISDPSTSGSTSVSRCSTMNVSQDLAGVSRGTPTNLLFFSTAKLSQKNSNGSFSPPMPKSILSLPLLSLPPQDLSNGTRQEIPTRLISMKSRLTVETDLTQNVYKPVIPTKLVQRTP